MDQSSGFHASFGQCSEEGQCECYRGANDVQGCVQAYIDEVRNHAIVIEKDGVCSCHCTMLPNVLYRFTYKYSTFQGPGGGHYRYVMLHMIHQCLSFAHTDTKSRETSSISNFFPFFQCRIIADPSYKSVACGIYEYGGGMSFYTQSFYMSGESGGGGSQPQQQPQQPAQQAEQQQTQRMRPISRASIRSCVLLPM